MRDPDPSEDANERQTSSIHVRKSGPKVAQNKWPKTNSRYWLDKVFVRGKSGFYIRLQKGSRREYFALNTSEREAASAKARDIYLEISRAGIAATSAKLKPKSEHRSGGELTVGEFVSAVEAVGKLSTRTLRGYVHCLRTIVSEVSGIDGGRQRFDHKQGGAKQWADMVDAIPVRRITSDQIEKWKLDRLKSAGVDARKVSSAKRTCNTYIRGSRSLFSERLVKHLPECFRPTGNPFKEVELFEAGDMRYRSQINLSSLMRNARQDLGRTRSTVYVVFLLAIGAGLRRKEIDLLQWDMVDLDNRVIRLRPTDILQLKTPGSSDDIVIDAVVVEELRVFREANGGFFVIPSPLAPHADPRRQYYRCKPVFDQLIEWLREQGVAANKPIHELRKEVGALITTEQGLYQASRFLRHSDTTTTSRHYSDIKGRQAPGLGRFLGVPTEALAGQNQPITSAA